MTGYAEQLRIEAESVLDDPSFRRSPVQSRLLKYLVDRTAKGGAAPTQFEIAVDALGKDENFDLANDSYPRVQISRLRANLDAYYARNKPATGRRIALVTGQYKLVMVEPDTPKGAVREIDDTFRGSQQYAEASDPVPAADPMDMIGNPATRPPGSRAASSACLSCSMSAFPRLSAACWTPPAPMSIRRRRSGTRSEGRRRKRCAPRRFRGLRFSLWKATRR